MRFSPSDFQELILGARQGDDAARERVFVEVLPRLQAYVRLNADGFVLSREWSLDVAQSVCADALQGLDDFVGGTEGEFRSWIYKITLNKIRMRHRYLTAERRDVRKEASAAGGSGTNSGQLATVYGQVTTPSRDASAKEAIGRLEGAMERLTEEQRLVLTMVTVLELSHAEVAEQLGKKEPAVRKTLSRARARLSLLMAMDESPDG